MLECTHTIRWPSAEGTGEGVVRQMLSGSPGRREGWRAASVQGGVWVWTQSRKKPSSLRVRGSTVTNRPPRLAMWSMASRLASLVSAT
jgi:hypothetical protein